MIKRTENILVYNTQTTGDTEYKILHAGNGTWGNHMHVRSLVGVRFFNACWRTTNRIYVCNNPREGKRRVFNHTRKEVIWVPEHITEYEILSRLRQMEHAVTAMAEAHVAEPSDEKASGPTEFVAPCSQESNTILSWFVKLLARRAA